MTVQRTSQRADELWESACRQVRALVRDSLGGRTQASLASALEVGAPTLSKYLNGTLRGIVRPGRDSGGSGAVHQEKLVKDLLAALRLDAGAATPRRRLQRLELIAALQAAREAWQLRERSRFGVEERQRIDLASCLDPPVPPDVIRAVGIHDLDGALRLAARAHDLPGRGRALAYLLEVRQEPVVWNAVEDVLHELERGHPVRGAPEPERRGVLRGAEAAHLRATIGVAIVRASSAGGERTRDRGVRLIQEAGAVALMLPDPLQKAHALAAVTTAVTLTSGEPRPGGERPATTSASGDRLAAAYSEAAEHSPGLVSWSDGARFGARAAVARSRARKDPEGARRIVEALESDARGTTGATAQGRALAATASVWAYVDLDHAARLAGDIPEGLERDNALGAVAVALAEAGRLTGAVRLARQIEQPWEKARALGAISHAESRAARSTDDARLRARAHARATAARGAALSVPEPHLVVHALAALGAELALADRELAGTTLDRATALALGAPVPDHERVHCLAALARAAARAGHQDRARTLAWQAETRCALLEAQARIHGLISVAAAWQGVDAGESRRLLDEAAGGIAALASRSHTVHALVQVAGLRGRFGDLGGLEAALDRALTVAREMEPGIALDHALLAIVGVLVTLDEREPEALAIATGRIGGALQKAQAMAALTNAARGSSFHDYLLMARQALRDLPVAAHRAEVRQQIAYALIREEDLSGAEREIQQIEGHRQGVAWGRLASVHAGDDELVRAQDALERALGDRRPAWATMAAMTEAALAIAKLVEDEPILALLDGVDASREPRTRSALRHEERDGQPREYLGEE
jgi:hypothetical protein